MKTLLALLLTVSMAAGQTGTQIANFSPNKLYITNVMEMDLQTGRIEFKIPVDSAAKAFAKWVATYYGDFLTLQDFVSLWDEYKRECRAQPYYKYKNVGWIFRKDTGKTFSNWEAYLADVCSRGLDARKPTVYYQLIGGTTTVTDNVDNNFVWTKPLFTSPDFNDFMDFLARRKKEK